MIKKLIKLISPNNSSSLQLETAAAAAVARSSSSSSCSVDKAWLDYISFLEVDAYYNFYVSMLIFQNLLKVNHCSVQFDSNSKDDIQNFLFLIC